MEELNEKKYYTEAELQVFKEIIDKKLEKARSQYEFYQRQISDFVQSEDAKVKGLDDGTNSIEGEKMITLANRQIKYIGHLENALHRIKNKSYGICRETGKLIAKERLMAVPHATLSIEAKKR